MARLLNKPIKHKVSKFEAKGNARQDLQKTGYLGITRAAHYLGIHPYTLREHIAHGWIEPFMLGKRQYLDSEALETLADLLQKHGSLAAAQKYLQQQHNQSMEG